MAVIKLTGSSYQSRSIPAAAQRVVNLYQEPTPPVQGEPLQYWDYETPGLIQVRSAPAEVCRCLYTASNGDVYTVYGQNLYYMASTGDLTLIGTFVGSALSDIVGKYTPVSMADDGHYLLIVMNTVDGWRVDITTRSGFTRMDSLFNADTNDGFTGSPLIAWQSSFFICSRIGTKEFYVSDSEATTFNSLQFGAKNTLPDSLVGVLSCHSVLWVVGQFSYEVWYLSGGDGTIINTFPFTLIPNAFGNWGCAALYSLVTANNEIYWLSQDRTTGKGVILQGQSDYSTKRISTHAIENEISSYPTISDATAFIYQQNGHQFYQITFPSANDYRGKTWCYDSSTNLWHERVFTDRNGLEWRHRALSVTEAYGKVWAGDWATNALYQLDLDTYNDFGYSIVRKRTFMHQLDQEAQRRISFRALNLFMETGNSDLQSSPNLDVVECTFTAADGTLLQDYDNTNDVGSDWTKVSGTTNGVIHSDELTASTTGAFIYTPSGTPGVPDYTVSWVYRQNDYSTPPRNGSVIYASGRSISNDGYVVSITSNGTALSLHLTGVATPVVIVLGTISSGYLRVSLRMIASAISVTVYRSQDGYWLQSDATWSPSPATAISVTDVLFPAAGVTEIGGTWV